MGVFSQWGSAKNYAGSCLISREKPAVKRGAPVLRKTHRAHTKIRQHDATMQIILIKGRLEIHIFLAETTPPDQCLSRPVVRVLKHFHVISCSSVSRRISKMLHRTRFSINLQEAWILTTSLPVNNCIDIKQCPVHHGMICSGPQTTQPSTSFLLLR